MPIGPFTPPNYGGIWATDIDTIIEIIKLICQNSLPDDNITCGTNYQLNMRTWKNERTSHIWSLNRNYSIPLADPRADVILRFLDGHLTPFVALNQLNRLKKLEVFW